MRINIQATPELLGQTAARHAASILNEAIRSNGSARLILSTGMSQFETLQALLAEPIDWSRVDLFHLDEYIGLPVTHPASFRRYLQERFIRHISPRTVHLVDGEGDLTQTLADLNQAVGAAQVDLGLIGIGENGHIAFNDPPADFETESPYIIVTLDEACKQQQVREGWFPDLAHVPPQAISMSVRQILKCRTIISCVPHQVKATAVLKTLTNPVTALVPATAFKMHPDVTIYLDAHSAAQLGPELLKQYA
jgi:glucosamine-6-phosphate deaminase